MAEFIAQFGGIGLAFLGAALAVGLCCVGSAKGTGMVGEAATGVLSENPEHFSKCLILQVLPAPRACTDWSSGSSPCLPWALSPAASWTSPSRRASPSASPVSPWPSAAGCPPSIRPRGRLRHQCGRQEARRLGQGHYPLRYRGVLRHPVSAGLRAAADERSVRAVLRDKTGRKGGNL